MSLIDVDDDQRWVPTHVQVTVLRGRGLRAKGKNGTSDVYTIIQVGKEKFITCVVEKTTAPEWKEECSFELLPGVLEAEGRSAYPPGSSDLILTVMHRALIGLDVFLGQATIPLDKVFQDRICSRNEWYKLNSKSGKKEKERGELQVTVQFTRNNLTASMYDLSAKDKPLSAFGRLKDRMKGKKREDSESASAVVPGGFGALGRQRARLPSDGGGEEDYEDDEGGEGRRSKMRNFFLRGKLRKSSDTRSSTSLGSESSESSSRGGSLSPTAGISVVVSDLSNSPSETSNLTADNSPEHTTHPSPKLTTHKRAFSDEAGQVVAAPPPQPRAVQSLKVQSGVLSQSSLCVNGSHVYAAEPLPSGNTATLGLLQKCSPLSRSLQNLTRRSEEPQRPGPGAEGRRWSFDKAGKEEKAAVAAALEPEQRPVQAAAPIVSIATLIDVAEPAAEGKKQKRNLFSHGRSDSAGKGAEQSQAPPPTEEKHKGWFGSKDSHNKPSPEVSPKVETISDAVPSHPLTHSPDNLSCAPSPAAAVGLALPGLARYANPFTPPPGTPTISPSNPFFSRLQCNPFFVDLLGDHALKSALPAPCLSSYPPWAPPASSSSSDPSSAQDCLEAESEHGVSMARERPRPRPLNTRTRLSPSPLLSSPLSENLTEWDESFEAFATSRLGSPKRLAPLEPVTGETLEGLMMKDENMEAENFSPTLLHGPNKIPVLQGHENQSFDWIQEQGLKKDLFPQTQVDLLSWEHSEEKLGGCAPIPSHPIPDKTGTDLFSEWDPEKPLDYSVSSPQFVGVCSLFPKSASAGQPIFSPYGSDFGETFVHGADQGRVGSLVKDNEYSHDSASVFQTSEGVREEDNFTGSTSLISGEEPMYETAFLPHFALEAFKLSADEPDVSLVSPGTNPFYDTIPSPKLPEIHLEGLENTTTDTLKQAYEDAIEQSCTNTNKIDLPEVNTHVAHGNLNESYAHIFDFTSSALANTDTSSSLSVATDSNTEINNNTTNKLATSPSPFVPEVVMNENHSKKPDGSFFEVPKSISPADLVDLPIKPDSSSISNEETLLESVSDVSMNTVEFLPEESVSVALAEVPAGSPVQVDKEDKLLLEEDSLDKQRTCVEQALEKDQLSTKTEETVPQKLSIVPHADTISDSTFEECTIAVDALCSDSNPITLGTDPEGAHQENCTEKNVNLKDSNSISAEINGCTLSDYLETTEPGPSVSPPLSTLNFVTAIEDPEPGKSLESGDTLSPETGIEQLLLKNDAEEMVAPPEEGGFMPSSVCTADSATVILEPFQLEKSHSDCDMSQPAPKATGPFQDSVPNEQHINEYPQHGMGDGDETKHSSTPKDSSIDLFHTPEVSSCPPSLPSEYCGSWGTTSGGWEKPGDKCQNAAFAIMEGELSSGKEESTNVLDVGTQPNTPTGSCSPTQKVKSPEVSYFDQLKGTTQDTWSKSGLWSTVSQDLLIDMAPEDFHKPQDQEEKQQALREDPLDSVLDWSDIFPTPKEIESAVKAKEELSTEAAPTLTSHLPVDIESSLFLHDCNPQASSTPSLLAETNDQVAFFPSSVLPHLPVWLTTETAQASSIAPPSKPPAMIDTPFMLLPQETQMAGSLLSNQQSSPHPVKPLNASAPQEEKKSEGRSVLVSGLEKLKSTIHPGRAAQQGEAEADRNKALSEGAAPYYHMSHNELVSVLMQREAELERQGAEFERQGALLEKREAELKKMKLQTRDLEDYIDRLLVRIMEQTPTLLQVRSILK